jgi:Ankyrin repeats (3 copies)/Ring finger domain
MQKYLYVLLLLWTANSNSMSYVKSFFGYDQSYFTTLLFQAASEDNILRIQEALNNYADPNTQDQDLDTPLHIAANNGHHRAVQVLLENGANVNTRNNNNETPLHRAVYNGHRRGVELLLDSNADIHAESNTGTPLYYAILRNNLFFNLYMVQILVGYGAVPSYRETDLATANNYQAILNFLNNGGGNVAEEENWEENCCVCLEKIDNPSEVKIASCVHGKNIHLGCLEELRARGNLNCPMCREPIVLVNNNGDAVEEENCCICLEVIENPEVNLPCGHGNLVHYVCLEHLKGSTHNARCPMCRGPLE